jgi:geranylgeranyl reductase family protein
MSQNIDSKDLDVIVIGAGPAGGQAARELAKLGRKVLIIEKSQEIGQPNYSTAGTPKETVVDFDLPQNILSSSWNKIMWATPRKKAVWKFSEPVGYVLDFAGLRKFLAEDAISAGAEILVGTTVSELIEKNGIYEGVKYHGVFGDGEVRAKIIIDASGHHEFGNTTLKINPLSSENLANGLEYQMIGSMVENKDTLAFYMGQDYAPSGYAWAFPMNGGNHTKVGICVYGQHNGKTLSELLEKFMNSVADFKTMEPIEVHAGAARTDGGVKNHVYKNLILIGDAAHQINPLGGEGIRHALHAGRMATLVVDEYLKKENKNTEWLKEEYEKKWKEKFYRKWKYSRILSELIYHKLDDEKLDDLIEVLKDLSPSDAYEILFNYKFEVINKHPILAVKLMSLTKELMEAVLMK